MFDSFYRRGGSFGSLPVFLILVICVIAPPYSLAAPGIFSLRLLYFFNTSCNHCKDIKPFIIDLSREYRTEGWISSAQDVKEYPFPVKIGSKELAPKYNVYGVPSMVVLRNEQFLQLVPGEVKIKNIKPLLRAIEAGALTVTEAQGKNMGDAVFVTGFVKIEGKDMKTARVFLVDHAKKLSLDPWLPREAVKSRFKKTPPRLLSHVLDKAVALKGVLAKGIDGALHLRIEDEVRYDSDSETKDQVIKRK